MNRGGNGRLSVGGLSLIAFTTACFRPSGSPGEVQRELMCRITVSAAPSQSCEQRASTIAETRAQRAQGEC